MADINATDLTAETLATLDGQENVVLFDTAEGKKVSLQVLADYVVQKATESLLGTNQTVAAAFTALNSNKYALAGGIKLSSDTDLNELKTPGNYYCYNNTHLINTPYANGFFSGNIKVESSAGEGSVYIRQIIQKYDSDEVYERYSDGSWHDWIKQPTRTEVDTLNSRLWKHIEMGDHRTLTLHFTTGFVSLFVYGTGSGMTPFMAAITASPDESSILVNPTTRNITVSGNRSSVVVTFPASWYNTWFSSDYEFTYEIS